MHSEWVEPLRRLPHAGRSDVLAGYAAAAAALLAALAYLLISSILSIVGIGLPPLGNVAFSLLVLPIVLVAAFIVGAVGWGIYPYRFPESGVLAGAIGVLATYLLTFFLLAPMLALAGALSLTGSDPGNATLFAIVFVYAAFVLTWWITIPVACATGYLYLAAMGED